MAELTRREVEVCRLVAAGLSTKGVARALDVSPSTVEAHVRNAARKISGDGPPRHRITVHVITTSEGQ
jgi:DNA-binding NarL/FixJ family response regulator